jgi:cytochrome c oxidase subunit IV
MNALDQIFGWLMIAFGVAQSVTNFRIQSFSHLTLSLSGTAAAMIVSGFLNVSRARHSDGLTRAFSVIGNLLILVLAVGMAWPVRYHLLHNWQALGILIVASLSPRRRSKALSGRTCNALTPAAPCCCFQIRSQTNLTSFSRTRA